MWIIIGVIVVAIAVVIMMPKKKIISENYDKAISAINNGDVLKAMELMDRILIFSFNDKYTPEEAQQAVKSLELLRRICKESNLDKDALIDKGIEQFRSISVDGGKVDGDAIEELESLVEKVSGSMVDQANMLINEAQKGNVFENERAKDKDFTDNITDAKEMEVINSIGKCMMLKRFNKGMDIVNENLPSQMNDYKATLLDMNAGMLFMNNQIQEAVNIYKELEQSYPENYRIITSLAEGLVKLGEYDEAVSKANIVVQFSKDRDSQNTAKKIIKKYRM